MRLPSLTHMLLQTNFSMFLNSFITFFTHFFNQLSPTFFSISLSPSHPISLFPLHVLSSHFSFSFFFFSIFLFFSLYHFLSIFSRHPFRLYILSLHYLSLPFLLLLHPHKLFVSPSPFFSFSLFYPFSFSPFSFSTPLLFPFILSSVFPSIFSPLLLSFHPFVFLRISHPAFPLFLLSSLFLFLPFLPLLSFSTTGGGRPARGGGAGGGSG